MHTATYYKIGGRWFLDFPQYLEKGLDPDDLERIGAFSDFLEYVAAGSSCVIFYMSPDPFEGADVMKLTGSSGGYTGGYYLLERFEDRPVHFELWLNTVIYYNQPHLPQQIYLKRAKP